MIEKGFYPVLSIFQLYNSEIEIGKNFILTLLDVYLQVKTLRLYFWFRWLYSLLPDLDSVQVCVCLNFGFLKIIIKFSDFAGSCWLSTSHHCLIYQWDISEPGRDAWVRARSTPSQAVCPSVGWTPQADHGKSPL